MRKSKYVAPVMFRQGDVLLVQVDGLPEGTIAERADRDRVVLAYGEVTGHAHAIAAREARSFKSPAPVPVHTDWNAERFLQVATKAFLRHEEHATIELPAGTYAVIQQREYSPEEIRRVAD
jgi:hypothetical protein